MHSQTHIRWSINIRLRKRNEVAVMSLLTLFQKYRHTDSQARSWQNPFPFMSSLVEPNNRKLIKGEHRKESGQYRE